MFRRTAFTRTLLAASLLLCGTAVNAAESPYTDSVYEWGSWELGIEPASGGPIAPANRPVRVQQKNMQFRPNDNSTFTGAASKLMTTSGTLPTPAPITKTTPGVTAAPPGAAPGLGNLR